MYDFAKEMYFDEKTFGDKSAGDKTPSRLPKSPVVMVCASGVSLSHKMNSF